MNCKTLDRDRLKAKRKSLSRDAVSLMSQAIQERLISAIKMTRINHCAIYAPIQNEPALTQFIAYLNQISCHVYLPKRTTLSAAPYCLAPWQANASLKPGPFGVLEPDTAELLVETSDNLIDCWIVPGLAFSPQGVRVGFGQGYYDRLLKNAKGLKVGIAYDFQIINSLQARPHDVNMDWVITQSKTYMDTLHS